MDAMGTANQMVFIAITQTPGKNMSETCDE
jgi:hypothetical protein